MSMQKNEVLINKYKLMKQLGQGGMAQVWLAEEIKMGNRQVAVKVQLPGISDQGNQILQARFQREIEVSAELAKADTTNVVKALTVEPFEDGNLLIMEYMVGGDLEKRISDHPLGMPVEDVIKIAKDILIALDAIHNHPLGIIHRDIKPSNILFNFRDEACLADFGLAQKGRSSGDLSFFIEDGRIAFTPLYRAPELKDPQEIAQPHSDIFSFGCVLWEMLTGKIYRKHKPGTKPSTLRSDIPAWLERLTMQCLIEDRWERLQYASIILEEIEKNEPNGDGIDGEKSPRRVKKVIVSIIAIMIFFVLFPLIYFPLFEDNLFFNISSRKSVSEDPNVSTVIPSSTPRAQNSPSVLSAKSQSPQCKLLFLDWSNPGINIMNMDGSDIELLSSFGENPFWSPDSKKILFTYYKNTKREIYTINNDGTDLTNISNNWFDDYSPSWSPDGKRITFISTRDNDFNVYVMNSDGSDVKKISNIIGIASSPKWSPLGDRIAFTLTRDDKDEIYLVDIDRSETERFSADGYSPLWSPDGAQIAFLSGEHNEGEIYIKNIDGTGIIRITNNSEYDGHFSWSPDSEQIVYCSGNQKIYIVNADGSNEYFLANGSNPIWSPDGERIYFISRQDNRQEIYVINTDGTGLERLTYNPDHRFSKYALSISPLCN